jgi:hypothetical protein
MQLRALASVAVLLVLAGVSTLWAPRGVTGEPREAPFDRVIREHVRTQVEEGRQIFRFDTFGDEDFWGGLLRLHEAIATVSPRTALAVGLKVDVDALPGKLRSDLRRGRVDLDDPANTLALLRLNAVLGVTGFFDEQGRLRSMGIQCALCHSTVDDSLAPGIGRRLDGWAARDLNVGAIVAGWGSATHWNAFVANLEMHGKGTFYDPRLNDPVRFPIAAANGFRNVRNQPDLITSKLAALHLYQLAIPAPKAPEGSFDRSAAARGETLFNTKAQCATCHVPPLFTEPGWNMHRGEELGIDNFQADRAPDRHYRTAPLKGLWTHQKGGFYHDGRFPTLRHVIDNYNAVKGLGLTGSEVADLAEYLKSL